MKNKFSLLYYTTAFHASHGGSTHSKHFFQAAQRHEFISEIQVFPGHKTLNRAKISGSLRAKLRSNPLLQTYFFNRRNNLNLSQLLDTIRQTKPDAILIRLDSNFLQIEKLISTFPNLLIATEVNASPFDESFSNIAFKQYFRRRETAHLARASCNFFVSNNLRVRIMGNSLLNSRDFVVHNGVDTRKFTTGSRNLKLRDLYGISRDTMLIGYVGTLDRHKKIDVLLKAFKKVIEVQPLLRLIIIGDGSEKHSLSREAGELGIASSVIFSGWVNHDEIPDYLANIDLAIHHHAGAYMSPLKLFEYMACGLPVIGPNTPAVLEIFRDGQDIIITTGEVEDLVSKVLMLVTNVALRHSIADAGKQLVCAKYTWEVNADFIVRKIYTKLDSRAVEQIR